MLGAIVRWDRGAAAPLKPMARAQRATAPYGVCASRARDQSKRAGEPSARTRRLFPHPPTPAQAAPFASPLALAGDICALRKFPELAVSATCRFGAHGAPKGAFRPYPRCCSRSASPADTAPRKFRNMGAPCARACGRSPWRMAVCLRASAGLPRRPAASVPPLCRGGACDRTHAPQHRAARALPARAACRRRARWRPHHPPAGATSRAHRCGLGGALLRSDQQALGREPLPDRREVAWHARLQELAGQMSCIPCTPGYHCAEARRPRCCALVACTRRSRTPH